MSITINFYQNGAQREETLRGSSVVRVVTAPTNRSMFGEKGLIFR